MGVTDYMADRFPDDAQTVPFVLLTAVWVDPAADSHRAIYDNNRAAVRRSLEVGHRGIRSGIARTDLANGRGPWNPYLRLD